MAAASARPAYKTQLTKTVSRKITTSDFMYGRSLGEGAFARVVHCRRKDNLQDELEARLQDGARHNLISAADVGAIIDEEVTKHGGVSNVVGCLKDTCKRKGIAYNPEEWAGNDEDGKLDYVQTSYAVKIMEKAFITRMNKVDTVMAERRILSKLRSPWVIALQNSWSDEDYLYMVMELAPGGELLNMINNDKHKKESQGLVNAACDFDVVQFYISELTLALEFIHSKNVIHRDLKPENILIMSNGHLKLTDFGTAMEEDVEGDPTDFVGTAFYVSPEVLAGQNSSRASDLWGFAVIIYHMLVGVVPFWAPSEYLIFQVIQAHNNYAKLLTKTPVTPRVVAEASPDDPAEEGRGVANAPPVANEPLWMPLSKYAEAIAAREATAIDCEYFYMQEVNIDPALRRPSTEEDPESIGPFSAEAIIEKATRGELPAGMETPVCPTWCGEPVWKLEYPESIPPVAKDLIAALLVEEPIQRLGAECMPAIAAVHEAKMALNGLETEERAATLAAAEATAKEAMESAFANVRNHAFYGGRCNPEILNETPPYDPHADMQAFAADQMSRTHEDLSDEETAVPYPMGAHSSTDSPWASFLSPGEYIAMEGLLTKRAGFSRRTRQFVLTTGPRMLYFDPSTQKQKGEIAWTKGQPVGTFKKDDTAFDVICTTGRHSGRHYNLTSNEPGGSDKWIKAIELQLQAQREH